MITHYRVWHTGGVRIIDRPVSRSEIEWHMTHGPEHQTATLRRNGSQETVTGHTMETVTRDGHPVRVDWLAIDGYAYVWWEDTPRVMDNGHTMLCKWPTAACAAECAADTQATTPAHDTVRGGGTVHEADATWWRVDIRRGARWVPWDDHDTHEGAELSRLEQEGNGVTARVRKVHGRLD